MRVSHRITYQNAHLKFDPLDHGPIDCCYPLRLGWLPGCVRFSTGPQWRRSCQSASSSGRHRELELSETSRVQAIVPRGGQIGASSAIRGRAIPKVNIAHSGLESWLPGTNAASPNTNSCRALCAGTLIAPAAARRLPAEQPASARTAVVDHVPTLVEWGLKS
jgi:hypothetical protein